MSQLKIQQLDYRYILIDSYKQLGLNELDLSVLLVCDNILKEEEMLITAEILALKMTYDVKTLDEELVSLINRGYLSYIQKDKSIVTSIKPMLDRLVDNTFRVLVRETSLDVNEEKGKVVENVYSKFEKTLGRTLSPIEFQKIREWIAQGVKEQMILESLEDCKAKSTRVTIRAVDKIIIKKLSSQDISKEGYSSANSTWKANINDTIDLLGDKVNDK